MSDGFEPCEGGCTCGHVRYSVKTNPFIVHACHCRGCQRQTGAPHVLNALYEAEMVELTHGNVEIIKVPSPSGEGQLIARCPGCKVAVYSNYSFGGLWEHMRFLRVGTLDNPDVMPPDVHIYTSTKLPWYIIPDGHLAVDEYYDLRETWSPQSLQRFKACRAALQ